MFTVFCLHNSLILHCSIYQILYGNIYFIKYYYIYLEGYLIKTRWVIFWENQGTSNTHFTYNKSFNLASSISHATLLHIFNGYDICLNTTNYLIFNMQDFRNGLWFSVLNLFWSGGIPSMYYLQVFIPSWLGLKSLPGSAYNSVFLTSAFILQPYSVINKEALLISFWNSDSDQIRLAMHQTVRITIQKYIEWVHEVF